MYQRIMRKEIVIPSSLPDVWHAWTTSDGAVAFFAPKANIELKIGGAYELYFDLEAQVGLQGSEGMRILSFLPMEMLSFSWNAPPEMPNVRKERAWVVMQFETLSAKSVKVKFCHLGWGTGEEWDRTYAYFDRAWDIVLKRLKERFEKGPIDWENIL